MTLHPCVETGVAVARQRKILDAITASPLGSYVFSGPPGVGKTTIMREVERLARIACWKNFGVYSRTAMQYQREATAAARGEQTRFVSPQTVIDSAAQQIRWSFFLDDIDKLTGSEFIRLQLFELVDVMCAQRNPPTQLCMTTNMRKDEFKKYFGDAIAWRVQKHCLWVPMEREP